MSNAELPVTTTAQADQLSYNALSVYLNDTNDILFDGLQVPLFGEHDAASVISALSNHNGHSPAMFTTSPDLPLFSPSHYSSAGYDLNTSPLFSDTLAFPTLEHEAGDNNTPPNALHTGPLCSPPKPRHSRLPSLVVSHVSRMDEDKMVESEIGSPWSPGRTRGSVGGNPRQFLSPNYLEESEFQEDYLDSSQNGLASPSNGPIHRNADGSWQARPSDGTAGLSPHDRDNIRLLSVPTLGEQEKLRDWETKKCSVELWITSSTPGSEAGDPNVPDVRPRRRFIGRRRAKSTNDAPSASASIFPTLISHRNDLTVPGPGIYLDISSGNDEEDDEGDEDDDTNNFFATNFERDGIQGLYQFPDNDIGRAESPPADISRLRIHNNDSEDNSDHIDPLSFPHTRSVSPWADPPVDPYPSTERHHPTTANAAIVRFQRRAQDLESASFSATIGSRRLSDLEFHDSSGVFSGFSWKHREKGETRSKFFGSILAKRNSITGSSLLKRKNSYSSSHIPLPSPNTSSTNSPFMPKEDEKLSTSRRLSNWARSKSSPRPGHREAGNEEAAHGHTLAASWKHAKAAIATRRNRSKSELGKPTEESTRSGGDVRVSSDLPPLLSEISGGIRKTLHSLTHPKSVAVPSDTTPEGKDMNSYTDKAIVMDLPIQSEPVEPTMSGFKSQVRQLNPRLPEELIERFALEQMRRYTRLAQMRVDHLQGVRNGKCSSGKFCFALGGESNPLIPRVIPKDGDTVFVGFQIPLPGISSEDLEAATGANADGSLVLAQFPPGVPLPPVPRLPAEFECPICFEVKSFYKPSDWTKHVLEDVQPFTCTFPNCTEPKSFKRKADWVRHENERHRQLENWTCDLPDCIHTCYRKENFAQHLVREHKMQETKGARGRDGRAAQGGTDIWGIVDRCRHEDRTKLPTGEPCRFCGNICNSWKKLMVHLGKHMEQISMPVIPALERSSLSADTVLALIPTSVGATTTTVSRPKAHSTASGGVRPQLPCQRPMLQKSTASVSATATPMIKGESDLFSSCALSANQFSHGFIPSAPQRVHSQSFSGGAVGMGGMSGGVSNNASLPMPGHNQLFTGLDQTTSGTEVDYFSQTMFSSGTVESPMAMRVPLVHTHNYDAAGPIMHSYPPPIMGQSVSMMNVLASQDGKGMSSNNMSHMSSDTSPALGSGFNNNLLTGSLSYPFTSMYSQPGFGLGGSQTQSVLQDQSHLQGVLGSMSTPLSNSELLPFTSAGHQQPHLLITRPTTDMLSESDMSALALMNDSIGPGSLPLSVLDPNTLPYSQFDTSNYAFGDVDLK